MMPLFGLTRAGVLFGFNSYDESAKNAVYLFFGFGFFPTISEFLIGGILSIFPSSLSNFCLFTTISSLIGLFYRGRQFHKDGAVNASVPNSTVP